MLLDWVRQQTLVSISHPASCSQCGLSLPWSAAFPQIALLKWEQISASNPAGGLQLGQLNPVCFVVQEQSSRFNPATGLEPGKLVKEVRLIGVQVGCVIGKSGENINQIRKVQPFPKTLSRAVLWQSHAQLM